MSTLDIEIVEAFGSLGMDRPRALKAASAFNRSGDTRMARVESDISELKTDLRHLSIRVEPQTWMLGAMSAGIATLIKKSFFRLTATELRAALAALALNQTSGAKALGVTPRTMREWCGGRSAIPKLVSRVMTISLQDKTVIDRIAALAEV